MESNATLGSLRVVHVESNDILGSLRVEKPHRSEMFWDQKVLYGMPSRSTRLKLFTFRDRRLRTVISSSEAVESRPEVGSSKKRMRRLLRSSKASAKRRC